MTDPRSDISDGLERERSRETTGPMFVGSGHDQEWLPDEQEMAMLLKLAHEVEGFICIKKMCEMTNVPHLKDKILSLFKSSAQRNQASAIALFSIVMKDDANVEEGLVNNAIDQMLRDFHVAPHDYDSAKSLLMGGDQEADVGER